MKIAGVSLSPAARPIATPLRREVSGSATSYSTAVASRMSICPYPSVVRTGSSQIAAAPAASATRHHTTGELPSGPAVSPDPAEGRRSAR
jgi:hypothetical protein